MQYLAAVAGVMLLWAAPAAAQSGLLSAYGGGGGGYYTAISSPDTRNGYSGPGTIQRQGGGWSGNQEAPQVVAYAPPCGNFMRAEARCRRTTQAWDPSFAAQRNW